jgi:hypothetical protein
VKAAIYILKYFLCPAFACGYLFVPQSVAEEPSTKPTPWAFESLSSIEPPSEVAGEPANAIDSFILAKLDKNGLRPNPPDDKRTLIRRAYFDLIGLPPTPEQIEAFLRDTSPEAYENLVNDLLASEHYGERWGRHWLDLARYADTSGDGADAPIPEARLYRDYIIDAFNQDMPYDQLIVEQIAGDLLAIEEDGYRQRDRSIATGYVALTRRFGNSEYGDMHLVIDNTLTTISKGMLGLNMSCARCHDHKFDPIPIEDYYGLYGYFSSTQYPHPSTEHGRERKNFVTLPGGELAYAVRDKKDATEIGDAPLLEKGDPGEKGDPVIRGFLSAIDTSKAEIPEGASGRLQFARWIASEDNPLTARVMANRIWQYHFGTGLVSTSSDFGNQGEAPSHPELLDWLANGFIESGWSFKAMHRLIMNSATYKQSSDTVDANMALDPENRLLWRYPKLRLEAEPMRDAVLHVSGRLKAGNPGQHPFPEPDEKNTYQYTQHRPFIEDYNHEYRSVYLPSRRLARHPYMATFDGPDTNECAANRKVSTVPLQSLFWMNSDFIQTNAQSFAEKVLANGNDTEKRIAFAFETAFARSPEEDEVSELTDFISSYEREIPNDPNKESRAWTSLCRVLLASNEFVYID